MNEPYFLLYIESLYGKGQGLEPMGIFPSVEAAKAFANSYAEMYFTAKLKFIPNYKMWFTVNRYSLGEMFNGHTDNVVFRNFEQEELVEAIKATTAATSTLSSKY